MRRSPLEDQYAPLGAYLTRQAAAGRRRVELPFAQLEVAILARALPARARTRRDWWRNDGTEPHAWHGWLRAGWFVGAVSLVTETVTFTRGDAG